MNKRDRTRVRDIQRLLRDMAHVVSTETHEAAIEKLPEIINAANGQCFQMLAKYSNESEL